MTAVPRHVGLQADTGHTAPKAVPARHGATEGASRARVGLAVDPRCDPAALSPPARISQLGAILATGYRRLRLHQKALEESAKPEAQCTPAVNGDGAEPAKEAP